MVIVRHRELSKTIEMAQRFAADLHLYAELAIERRRPPWQMHS